MRGVAHTVGAIWPCAVGMASGFGKHGKGPGEFDTPHGIALDSTGRVYVADRANNRIQIFEPDGKFVAE